MNHLIPIIPKSRCLSILARGCAIIAIATLLSCETPAHLQNDFGASYREAIRAQTDEDHVRRSVAGSAMDGRAAALLYEAHINWQKQSADTDQPSAPALPPAAAGFFSGGASSITGSMPTGNAKP